MYYFYGFDYTLLLLIPAMIFTFIAQHRVNSAYTKYRTISNSKGITGAQAARRILDQNGLTGVPVEMTPGQLTDHYDPRSRVMRLSPQVYREPTIASVSIAAHEAGHAIQHEIGYLPLKVRNGIAPVVTLVSRIAWPMMLIGLAILAAGYIFEGNLIFDLGIVFFAGAVVFQTVTLPVELNASKRAIRQLTEQGVIEVEEGPGAEKMLRAAALTYVAALAVSLANLLRILAIRGRR